MESPGRGGGLGGGAAHEGVRGLAGQVWHVGRVPHRGSLHSHRQSLPCWHRAGLWEQAREGEVGSDTPQDAEHGPVATTQDPLWVTPAGRAQRGTRNSVCLLGAC